MARDALFRAAEAARRGKRPVDPGVSCEFIASANLELMQRDICPLYGRAVVVAGEPLVACLRASLVRFPGMLQEVADALFTTEADPIWAQAALERAGGAAGTPLELLHHDRSWGHEFSQEVWVTRALTDLRDVAVAPAMLEARAQAADAASLSLAERTAAEARATECESITRAIAALFGLQKLFNDAMLALEPHLVEAREHERLHPFVAGNPRSFYSCALPDCKLPQGTELVLRDMQEHHRNVHNFPAWVATLPVSRLFDGGVAFNPLAQRQPSDVRRDVRMRGQARDTSLPASRLFDGGVAFDPLAQRRPSHVRTDVRMRVEARRPASV